MSTHKISKLSFKGDSTKKKVVKRKADVDLQETSTPVEPAHVEAEMPKPQAGTGRITSSGTTIHGNFTKFMDELKPGDAIIINHPTSLADEMKIVRMVLSNISISISSPFSTDLISTTAFRFISAPKDDAQSEADAVNKKIKTRDAEELAAFGTYAGQGGTKFTYRVKCGTSFGGYKVVTENTKSEMTREDLLNMRSKKKADRFCS